MHAMPTAHNRMVMQHALVLARIANRRGLEVFAKTQAVYPAEARDSACVPDLGVAHVQNISERGIEARAELAVQIVDSTEAARTTLPTYAHAGCREVWLVDLARNVEVYALRGAHYERVHEDARGDVHAPSLGVTLRSQHTPKTLRIADGPDVSEI